MKTWVKVVTASILGITLGAGSYMGYHYLINPDPPVAYADRISQETTGLAFHATSKSDTIAKMPSVLKKELMLPAQAPVQGLDVSYFAVVTNPEYPYTTTLEAIFHDKNHNPQKPSSYASLEVRQMITDDGKKVEWAGPRLGEKVQLPFGEGWLEDAPGVVSLQFMHNDLHYTVTLTKKSMIKKLMKVKGISEEDAKVQLKGELLKWIKTFSKENAK